MCIGHGHIKMKMFNVIVKYLWETSFTHLAKMFGFNSIRSLQCCQNCSGMLEIQDKIKKMWHNFQCEKRQCSEIISKEASIDFKVCKLPYDNYIFSYDCV